LCLGWDEVEAMPWPARECGQRDPSTPLRFARDDSAGGQRVSRGMAGGEARFSRDGRGGMRSGEDGGSGGGYVGLGLTLGFAYGL